jgi:F-type H+-transporting ATPase subunit epsilon
VADHKKFPVEVLTPEGEVFNDEVQMISTRTSTGSIGILANHTPLLAMLDPTELRLYKSDSDVVTFAQGEGYLQMIDNHALLLVEDAIDPDQLDSSDLDDKLKRAEEAYEQADEDSEERRAAAREKRRWEAFSKIAGGGSPGSSS